MTSLLGEVGPGLLALAALLLWPGLLIVRAPWPFVPFLSLSFWLVSWDWLAPGGPGRQRFLVVILAFSALFSGLRLLKPLGASRPSGPTLVVVAAALGRLAPFLWWPAAPGLGPAFSSSAAELLVWRDGLPASYLPLYPILGFGLGDSGLAGLAADVSLLAGLAPHRSLFLVGLASEGLLVLALFALARRFWPGPESAMGAVTLAVLGLLVAARSEAAGGTVLALALVASGAALVFGSEGRSPRVAAAALWAGAAVLAAPLAVMGAFATAAAIVARERGRGRGRLGLPVTLAVLLSAPALWRIADAGGLGASGWLPPVTAFLVVAGIPIAAGRASRPASRAPWVAACAVVALVATLADWKLRSDEALVTADDLAAAAWLRDHSRTTDVVCAAEEGARAWIPALAGRAASPPLLPPSVRARRPGLPLAACRFAWGEADSPDPAGFSRGRVHVTRVAAP